MQRLAAVFAATVLLIAAASVRAAPAPSAPLAVIWASHAIIVDLDSLSKSYTCDELWYRFRAVLLAIGARGDLRVMPYDCAGRSPRVELQFSLPQRASAGQASAALPALPETITLSPGRPAPLDTTDCELLQRINDELFSQLPVHVARTHWACASPHHTAKPAYRLAVQTLVPQPSKSAAGS